MEPGVGDAAEQEQTGRAKAVAAIWIQIPGAPPMQNLWPVRELSEPLHRMRADADAAGRKLPSDDAILRGVFQIARKMADDGLVNVWQPKTLAKTLGAAIALIEKPKTNGHHPPKFDRNEPFRDE